MSRLTALTALARRPQLLNTLAVAILAAACTTAPTASPSPASSPSPAASLSASDQPPTSAPTNGPTAAPTATLVPGQTFSADQIEHPTGATDIVLRLETGGGFVPMEFVATAAPQFTLYGDGTVIFQTAAAPPFGVGGALPSWVMGKMSEENIQALLRFALDRGRLAGARDRYENMMCADCSTTTFVLNAGGLNKTVSVYALSEVVEPGPDQADLEGFSQLKELLANFEAEAQAGTITDLTDYHAGLYRVTMYEATGAQPTSKPIEWPWDDIAPVEFVSDGDGPDAIRTMTRDEVSALVEVPNGGALGLWATTPEDELVQFAVRPLLPEEVDLLGQ